MGFNISGLAINKNYASEFEELQKELGWNLEKQSEIDFETASSNWTEDGVCDVYFSEKGTLIFMSMDMCAESWRLKKESTLTFALSETSMAFNINYCENGVEKRSIIEVNGERVKDEGEKLEIEEKSEDTSEIIWNQLEVVIGKRFWDIEPDEKATRYVFGKAKKQEIKVENQQTTETLKIIKPISKEIAEKIRNSNIPILVSELYMHYWTENLTPSNPNDQNWQNQALFFWKAEEPFSKKSLPPVFENYQKKFFVFSTVPDNIIMHSGEVIPWFGMPGKGIKHYCEVNNKKVSFSQMSKDNVIQYILPVKLSESNLNILTDRENYVFICDQRFVTYKNNQFQVNEKIIPIELAYSIGGIHIVKKEQIKKEQKSKQKKSWEFWK